MDLTTNLRLDLNFAPSKSIGGKTVATTAQYLISDSMADGTGTDQSDLLWFDQRTLNTTTETLDLAGSLTDVFGDTVTFVTVKGFYAKCNGSASGNKLTIGGASSNAFTGWFSASNDQLEILEDGICFLWCPTVGYTVTAGTGDILEIETNYNGTYDIALFGTTA